MRHEGRHRGIEKSVRRFRDSTTVFKSCCRLLKVLSDGSSWTAGLLSPGCTLADAWFSSATIAIQCSYVLAATSIISHILHKALRWQLKMPQSWGTSFPLYLLFPNCRHCCMYMNI